MYYFFEVPGEDHFEFELLVLPKSGCVLTNRGDYFEKYANMHSVIVCWTSLAGVQFVLKAWIYLF